jgi:hypothetical protein
MVKARFWISPEWSQTPKRIAMAAATTARGAKACFRVTDINNGRIR